MKQLMMALILVFSSLASAESLYSDTWVNWSPNGKVYDVACFSKKKIEEFLKDVRVLQLNRRAFQYKDADGELKAHPTKNCFFEQKDSHPVSRDEFFEEIVSVSCSLNQIPFKDGDFRVLGTNWNTTSIKRLRDGKVWILPTSDCTFTTQLPKKPMMPVPSYLQPQPQVPINSEFVNFPGQADQMAQPQPAQPARLQEVAPPVETPAKAPSKKSEAKKETKKQAEVPKREATPVPEPEKDENESGTIKTLINTLN